MGRPPKQSAAPRPALVLVTGSRAFTDRTTVASALGWVRRTATENGFGQLVVVHGAARGADAIASAWARQNARLGVVERRFPADWEGPCTVACKPGHRQLRLDGSSYCPQEGLRRNQRMVDHVAAVADPRGVICVGFLVPGQACRGTRDCMRRAREAGLPVRSWQAGGLS
jgi:hypothetical protein